MLPTADGAARAWDLPEPGVDGAIQSPHLTEVGGSTPATGLNKPRTPADIQNTFGTLNGDTRDLWINIASPQQCENIMFDATRSGDEAVMYIYKGNGQGLYLRVVNNGDGTISFFDQTNQPIDINKGYNIYFGSSKEIAFYPLRLTGGAFSTQADALIQAAKKETGESNIIGLSNDALAASSPGYTGPVTEIRLPDPSYHQTNSAGGGQGGKSPMDLTGQEFQDVLNSAIPYSSADGKVHLVAFYQGKLYIFKYESSSIIGTGINRATTTLYHGYYILPQDLNDELDLLSTPVKEQLVNDMGAPSSWLKKGRKQYGN